MVQMLLPNVSSFGMLSNLLLAVEEKRIRLFQERFYHKMFGIKIRFEGKFLYVNILLYNKSYCSVTFKKPIMSPQNSQPHVNSFAVFFSFLHHF